MNGCGMPNCQGCGHPKKQLVQHLKSEKSCKTKCEEIDIESFDKQLKAFRNQRLGESEHATKQRLSFWKASWRRRENQQKLDPHCLSDKHFSLVFASLLACDLAANSMLSFHQNYNLVSIFRF